jgi:hypothetical protein
MAVNKPTGDNARRGAVKKRRSQKQSSAAHRVDQTQQETRSIHGCEKAGEKDQGRQKVQGGGGGEKDGAGRTIARAIARCHMQRNRRRRTTSLEERLLKFAQEMRAAAGRTKPGPEQDALIQKAPRPKRWLRRKVA